ncbi:MAG TPA: hypothetical protein VLY04_21965 [Bryobacteraceae bacterium]|nr:hypothetical protein [Bryobacteraceae bacterium]
MEFFHQGAGQPSHLGVLPGTFNPITVAHLALAQAALGRVEQVLFVLPRAFPHKPYQGASFQQRIEMLRTALRDSAAFSVAASDGGLFVEIAGECRAAYGEAMRLSFLCGRDAAERIAAWDYGRPNAFASMLGQFDLLVADRDGEYHPPRELRARIHALQLPSGLELVSASDVRERIVRGQPWEHLVPAAVHQLVREAYG